MGKLDELKRMGGAAAAESMGVGVPLETLAQVQTLATPARLDGVSRLKNIAAIPVDKIGPDATQPREEFDPEALQRLAESLKARGQLQPIRVRWDESRGRYVILFGERRWRAAQLAGLATVNAIISEGSMSAAELLSIQVVENCLREDLRPIEQAQAFRALMTVHGWTTRDVAQELAITQGQVSKALALLNLPGPIQEQVEDGQIAPATAYELSKIRDPQEQVELAKEAVAGRLKRSELRDRVSQPRPNRGGRPRAWTHEVPGVAKIRLEALAEDADPAALYDALKAAAAAYKRTLPKPASTRRQDAA